MLEIVRISACRPAPPLGSVAAKLITSGNDSDMIQAKQQAVTDRAFYPRAALKIQPADNPALSYQFRP
jgi:hypothetical protein